MAASHLRRAGSHAAAAGLTGPLRSEVLAAPPSAAACASLKVLAATPLPATAGESAAAAAANAAAAEAEKQLRSFAAGCAHPDKQVAAFLKQHLADPLFALLHEQLHQVKKRGKKKEKWRIGHIARVLFPNC